MNPRFEILVFQTGPYYLYFRPRSGVTFSDESCCSPRIFTYFSLIPLFAKLSHPPSDHTVRVHEDCLTLILVALIQSLFSCHCKESRKRLSNFYSNFPSEIHFVSTRSWQFSRQSTPRVMQTLIYPIPILRVVIAKESSHPRLCLLRQWQAKELHFPC